MFTQHLVFSLLLAYGLELWKFGISVETLNVDATKCTAGKEGSCFNETGAGPRGAGEGRELVTQPDDDGHHARNKNSTPNGNTQLQTALS